MPGLVHLTRCGVPSVRCLCTGTQRVAVKNGSEEWDVFAGVALSRPPLIAPAMTAVEQRYASVVGRIEEQGSLMSDFELKHIKDIKLLAKRAQLEAEGKELSALDEQIGATAEAQRDDWARRADSLRQRYAIGDTAKVEGREDTSLSRKLDERLFLVVKQKFARKDGYSSPWILPQIGNRTDENLKQTAERCLCSVVDGDLHASVSANAPFSVYSYRYAAGLRKHTSNKSVGAKVFFFNALISPQSEFRVNSSEVHAHKWVTAEELRALVRSQRYKKSLSPLFLS